MLKRHQALCIGYISKTHGVKGWVCIKLDGKVELLRASLDQHYIFVHDPNTYVHVFQVKKSIIQNSNNWLVQFKGLHTLNDVKAFVGAKIEMLDDLVKVSNQSTKKTNTRYLNYTVMYQGYKYGIVQQIYYYASYPLLKITLADEPAKHVYIPAVPNYIAQTNDQNKTLYLKKTIQYY